MTTTTRIESHGLMVQIDVFLAFKLRVVSLEFYAAQVRRHKRRGERAMAELATLVPSGDVLADARHRASCEDWIEEIFEDYNAAVKRMDRELRECGSV